jgi:cell division protein FtsX
MIRDEPNRIYQAELIPLTSDELVPVRPAAVVQPWRVVAAVRRRITWPSLRTWLIGLAVLVAVAAVAALVWLLVLAVLELIAVVTAAIAWAAAHWWLILLIPLALLLLAAGGGSRCPGLHCGGCRR